MRIIDKNHDYYDYLADPTDTLVFDRRGSFILEKSSICDRMRTFGDRFDDVSYRHLLLQCGATFWLFLLTTTKLDDSYTNIKSPADYDIELLATWKNYGKPNRLLDIRLVSFPNKHLVWNYKKKEHELKRDKINIDEIKTNIDRITMFNERNSSYLGKVTYSTSKGISWVRKEYTIPLLSACGIANIVSPIDMFSAIEEYFSIEKTKAERTEPLGATNNDKIVMHGFDTKTSFRGK